jgi:hypothetical protein
MFGDEEFYKQMILAEEDRKEEGWTERVKSLKEIL